MKNFLWKIYFLLLVFSLIGAGAIIPYTTALSGGGPEGIPQALFLIASFLQAFLLTAIIGFFGVKLSLRTGLGLPVLENLLYRDRGEVFRVQYHVVIPVLLGLLCGLVMIFIDLLLIDIFQLKASAEVQAPIWWKGLLASFYGGMSEEIMLRLFTMNLIIFILNKIHGNVGKESSSGKVVIAMILSSLIFGIGHLAAAIPAGMLSPGYLTRILVLNFVPGMLFGWLYWKRSFLSAMAAHFAADIVIHVIARFILDNLMQAS